MSARMHVLSALAAAARLAQATCLPALPDVSRLHRHTVQPCYPVSERILDALARHIPGLFVDNELELERCFTRLCRDANVVAIYHGHGVRHPFFGRPPIPTISDDLVHKLGWGPYGTAETIGNALRSAAKLAEPIHDQMEAYAGWLVTNPTFLAERDLLRAKWDGAVAQRRGIPQYSVRLKMELRGERYDGNYDRRAMAADFMSFYGRWQLAALATWDLPLPLGANLGAPAAAGAFIGLEDKPAIQLPATVKLPVRYPLRDLIHAPPDEHLHEWQAVLQQKHPSHFNFARWQRIFHLHFWRNVVLAGAYQERFCRRTEALDLVFAHYFGDGSEESVRKQRQWIDRRLQPMVRSTDLAQKR
jgi:hypothetical protein